MLRPVKLAGPSQRAFAKGQWLDSVPDGWIVSAKEPTRSLDQNAKMWAMLSDVSKAEILGRKLTPERWKSVFMISLKHEVQFEHDLDGQPFPIGLSTKSLTVKQMAELIEFIYATGAQNGVQWSEAMEQVT